MGKGDEVGWNRVQDRELLYGNTTNSNCGCISGMLVVLIWYTGNTFEKDEV